MSETVTSPIPADQSSAVLFQNMGKFWSQAYADADFVRQYCRGSSLLAAQVYIDFLEALNSLGVATIPSFHREGWIPIMLRKSERNTGRGVSFYIGLPEVNIGAQEDNSFRTGQVFSVGGNVVRDGYVVYPINGQVPDTGVYKLCSRIWEPETVLVRNVDYYVSGGCIVFRASEDPFAPANFDKWQNKVVNDGGDGDMEVLIWGADALFDRKFIQNSFGSAIKYNGESGEYYNTVVTELWNLRTSGANVATVNRTFNRVLGLPVCDTDGEVVQQIVDNADGSTLIVTDGATGTYRILSNQTLLSHIRKGVALRKWEPLTASLTIYHARDPVNTIAALANRFTGISLSNSVIYAPGMTSAVSVGNIKSDLVYVGKFQSTGKHVFRFALGGTVQDQDLYWNYVWQKWSGDSTGVSMEDAMADYITSTVYRTYQYLPADPSSDYYDPGYNPGVPDLLVCKFNPAVGALHPFEFMTTNVTRDNLTVVVVDFAALPEYIRNLEPLGLTVNMMPAHAYTLYILEAQNPNDEFDLEDESAESFSPAKMVPVRETAGMIGEPGAVLTYKDSKPIIRQVRRCRW